MCPVTSRGYHRAALWSQLRCSIRTPYTQYTQSPDLVLIDENSGSLSCVTWHRSQNKTFVLCKEVFLPRTTKQSKSLYEHAPLQSLERRRPGAAQLHIVGLRVLSTMAYMLPHSSCSSHSISRDGLHNQWPHPFCFHLFIFKPSESFLCFHFSRYICLFDDCLPQCVLTQSSSSIILRTSDTLTCTLRNDFSIDANNMNLYQQKPEDHVHCLLYLRLTQAPVLWFLSHYSNQKLL
jgi:hypothetical protein